MDKLSDTIAAIATPPGEGGLGVVRISGPEALSIGDAVFRSAHGAAGKLAATEGYRLRYGVVCDPATGMDVDECVAAVMRSPHSYTGEDVVELSCHGGSFVMRRVLGCALSAGARMAGPGEFTQRAFLNGRLDLVQAEAVIDMIRAKGESARSASLSLLKGGLSAEISSLRDDLVGLEVFLEAAVDFPEEEIEYLHHDEIVKRLVGVVGRIASLEATFHRGKMAREGLNVVIAGKPNVGKSSLLNTLLREERAIVTPVAGTTRDLIVESITIDGVRVQLTDTAGVRETTDAIESAGVERAARAVGAADLVLLVFDAAHGLTAGDREAAHLVEGLPTIVVLNKADLGEVVDEKAVRESVDAWSVVKCSTVTSDGSREVESALREWIDEHGGGAPGEGVAITRLRHWEALERARRALLNALAAAEEGKSEDFISIDVREAADACGELLGIDAPDELLDRVFSEFCIGK